MYRKGTKDEGNKTGCTEFEANFKYFRKMFENMSKRCMGQEIPIDCCAMMDEKVMEKMRKCCGPRPGPKESHSEGQKT
jgi:hypothetical protein